MTGTISDGWVEAMLGGADERGRLLATVLDAAVTALSASGGMVLAVDAQGDLELVAERGLRLHAVTVPQTVPRGTGVLGELIVHPRLRRGRLGEAGLDPAPGEPATGQLLACPLHAGTAVVAVLALLRLDPAGADTPTPVARPFDAHDEQALAAFAVQAQAGIETAQRLCEAQRLAVTDELTGLWNARYLSLALVREVERASRFGHSLAVLMLDVDRFKAVNDAHGHARGDEVLRELARRLSREVRDVDVLARYGGEEFVVVAPETDAAGGTRLAARLVEAVGEAPFTHGDGPGLAVTASVGVAVFPGDGRAAAALMAAADRAMYAAKAGGRDRWVAAIACTP